MGESRMFERFPSFGAAPRISLTHIRFQASPKRTVIPFRLRDSATDVWIWREGLSSPELRELAALVTRKYHEKLKYLQTSDVNMLSCQLPVEEVPQSRAKFRAL
jgi:hypothetical protein